MAVAEVVLDDVVLEQRDRLLTQLSDQRFRVADLWNWYRGRQQVPDVPAKYQAAYCLFLNSAVTPWARLVVDAICERLRVQGVHAEDEATADAAWRRFTRSRLRADQRLVYTEALIGGTGYVSVIEARDGDALIVPESSFEVTHEPDLADRGVVAGALKLFALDYTSESWVCELYRPEATYRWVTQLSRPLRTEGEFPIDNGRRAAQLRWEGFGGPVDNPLGIVPVVPFENRVNVLSGGMSEIEDCIPILQRIDRLTLDQMLASHFASFKQKWATGLQVPRDPETGKPVEPYSAAVNRLWVSENPDTRFGNFDTGAELNQYLSAVDSQIAALAAISRVPAHYLMQRNLANPPSAESLIASESGLVAKVDDRQGTYGEAWELALYLAARMAGEDVPDLETFEIEWVSPEKRNPAQVADAAVKMQTVGVPQWALWAYMGFTPQQVAEFRLESAQQALLNAALLPSTQNPTPPTDATNAAAA